jgi:hypothetical protein
VCGCGCGSVEAWLLSHARAPVHLKTTFCCEPVVMHVQYMEYWSKFGDWAAMVRSSLVGVAASLYDVASLSRPTR